MLRKTISALIISSLLPVCAYAQFDASNLSAGLKLGMFMADSAAADDYEKATGIGVDIDNAFGFGLHADYKITDNWYVDVEYTSVGLEATFKMSGAEDSDTLDVDSFAVYGAYRSTGEFYYLGKLGLISESVTAPGGFDESEVGLSFSIGGGYQFQDNLSIEAEFTSIEKNVGFIGVTGRFTFQ